ncbi:MAG: FKBP-type peptidyl-prolyl cis-trans isomerase [Bacteroidales bacterium]|jgi:FKBP-type peptidyl-prolyl cis-trans isomerase|nr:FKBP-type peptidyl-prolyl cis-trans isomerase [Bacteroidales bacterium]
MKKALKLIFIFSFSALITVSCKTTKNTHTQAVVLKTFNDTISYIIGADVGGNLKKSEVEINNDIFFHAFNQGYNQHDTLLSKEVRSQIMNKFQREHSLKQQSRNLAEAQKNKLSAQAFLEENKKKPDIVELPSGLQYKIIKQGDGSKPGPEDEVTVHYEGRLLDGTIFDSSYERGEPISFSLNGVIKGWTEGLQLMNTGSTYELFIPSELAYGERGVGQIPGGAMLIFKVELISINNK